MKTQQTDAALIDQLRAQIAALKAERDEAYRALKPLSPVTWRAKDLATIDRLTAERDAAKNELKIRTQECTSLIEEAQALMRPQAEWEQEVAELRASAEMAMNRWRRSEAIRKAAVTDLITLTDLSQGLVASIHGDGNGRCWCGAKEADRLRGFLERTAREAT